MVRLKLRFKRFTFHLFVLLSGLPFCSIKAQNCSSCDLVRSTQAVADQELEFLTLKKVDSLTKNLEYPMKRKLGDSLRVYVRRLSSGECLCISNARAVKHRCENWDEERNYIFYCPNFMETISTSTLPNRYIVPEFIMGHELSHHILGHSLSSMWLGTPEGQETGISHLNEYIADGLGLFLLYYKYASEGTFLQEDDIDLIFNELSKASPDLQPDNNSHPSIEDRKKQALLQLAAFPKSSSILNVDGDAYRKAESQIPDIAFRFMNSLGEELRSDLESDDNRQASKQASLAVSFLKRNKLDSANFMLHRAKFLTHEEATREKVARWENKVSYALSKNTFWKIEPQAGIELTPGKAFPGNEKLNIRHYPTYKAGLRVLKQNWQTEDNHFMLDLLYVQSVSDIVWEDSKGTGVAAERLKTAYLEIKPNTVISFPAFGLKRKFSNEKRNLSANGLSVALGRPFYIPTSSSYQNFATDSHHNIKAKWQRYNGGYNIFKWKQAIGVLSSINVSLIYTKWNRISTWASYSVALSTYSKRWVVSTEDETFNNRYRTYEATVTLRYW
jgi:hypothetical protein